MRMKQIPLASGKYDVLLEFDGIMDMREHVLNGVKGQWWFVSRPGYADFFGTSTIEEADNLLLHGWELGRQELTAKVDTLATAVEELTGYRREVTGLFFDVGSVLTGEPECWFEPEMEERRNSLKVVLNAITSGGVSASAIQNRGAAIVCLLDTLQKMGWAIELEICCKSHRPAGGKKRNNEHVLSRVPIGCSPLDLDSLAFVLAHPSFPRRFMYSCHDIWANTCCDSAGSHGHPTELTKEEIGENVMYFGSLSYDEYGNGLSQFGTMEGATKWLHKTLERLTAQQQD